MVRLLQRLNPLQYLHYLRDLRFIRVVSQIIFSIVIVYALAAVWQNVYNTLASRNLLPTFTFLERRSGFAITQTPEWYSADSTYGEAFYVGVMNTLQVVWIGLILATILGVLLGIFLLNSNWLIKTISRGYVEILRNTPLLVQLIFWYFVAWLGLPENDIMMPNESVMVVPLRFFPHLFILLGSWFISTRMRLPARLMNGVLTGFILFEGIIAFANDSYTILGGLALIGLLFWFISNLNIVVDQATGFLRGIAILFMGQFAGHLLLDVLHRLSITAHPRVVYGDVLPVFILGRSGFVIPEFTLSVNFSVFMIGIVIALVAGYFLYRGLGILIDQTGMAIPRTLYTIAFVALFALGSWYIARAQPVPDTVTVGEGETAQVVPLAQARAEELLEPDQLLIYNADPFMVRIPERNRFGRVLTGVEISPSYMALLIALVIYTSAFIGEIVRAGIQAVPYGQVEAARALGLSGPQTLRMIVLPQALRVIIPPLGNQYLNLSKNSSLAAAVAFADTYQVGQTIMNQSGQSITGFFIVLMVYLSMSLIIAFFMSLVNSRFQIVTR